MILRFLTKYRDWGLLLLRLGMGAMFIAHGMPKLLGGPEAWAKIGAMVMPHLGINFTLAFWGFLAGLAEVAGGLLFLVGFWFRAACIVLVVMMLFALQYHFAQGDPFQSWSHAAEAAIVFFSFIFIGPGKYSVDRT